MDIQKLFDMMSANDRVNRGNYHLTLGKAIKALSALPGDATVRLDTGQSVGDEHSYRGYYADLSFELSNDVCTVSELLARCQRALGSTYEGYKGGDFVMDENTPLWAANYGCSGAAIVDASMIDGVLVLATKDMD